MKGYTPILLLNILLIISNCVCSQDVVSVAHNQFNRFDDVHGGWLAADGTISLLLPDGNTLWLFGDCFIGEKSGEFGINTSNSTFIHNAAIIDNGSVLQTVHGGTSEHPTSLIPEDGTNLFWPEHATIEDDTIKIFAVEIILTKNNNITDLNFTVGRTHIASFKYPEMEYISTKLVNCITDSTMRFGTQILKKDDYTYIFGKKDITNNGLTWPIPVLARVNNSVDDPWYFYAGEDNWSLNCDEAVPIGDRPMSESFSVYEKNNKFYLIMHEIWFVNKLFILESDDITGPWNRKITGGKENAFCILPKHENNFTYNLFAHPQFVNNNKILISFNVNINNFSSIYDDARNYRARFLWLSVEDAVTVYPPDTIKIFKDFTNTSSVLHLNNDTQHYIKISHDKINFYINKTISVISIYNTEGKLLYYKKINDDTILNLTNLPNTVLIIKLFNENGISTKKYDNTL